jgi:MoaA/NifB/PqqE/SkfB family radical SAM enzyme
MLSDQFPIKRLVIEPTYACNLRCLHCYVHRSARAVKRLHTIREALPVSSWQKILQTVPAGISIHFTGGEIFVYPEIFTLLERTSTRFPFTVSTNGTRLRLEACRHLADLNPSHVTISILGTESIHDALTGVRGSYKKAVSTINALGQFLPHDRLSVNFVLLPQNAFALVDVASQVERLGAARLVIQLFDPALNRCGIVAGVNKVPEPSYLDWSEINLDGLRKMLEEVKHFASGKLDIVLASDMTPEEIVAYVSGTFDFKYWRCAEVFNTMRCSPIGTVYTCTGLEIGSLEQHSILDLWRSAKFDAFRQDHIQSVLEPSCIGCCKIRRDKQINEI